MLVNLIFFGLISSGSVYCAVKYDKKYEELLPITCMSIGALLFMFGMAGLLKQGAFVVIGIVALLYSLTILEFFKCKKTIRETALQFWRNFFSAGFFAFIILYFVLGNALVGLVAKEWDDFSHWTDIVKVMTMLNDFGTNPESHSLFQSYPPAMALFQYMMQKINRFLAGESFEEWRCFFSYQIYFIAVMMPMLRNSKMKNVFHNIAYMVIVIFLPLIFFKFAYNSSMIDPFLAMTAAAGLLTVISWKKDEKDVFYSIYICLLIFTLVLTKDLGILFAGVLLIVYVVDNWLYNRGNISRKKYYLNYLIPVLALIIPKMLWRWKLAVTKSNINFNNKIDISVLMNVLLGKDSSYRSDVLQNYGTALIEYKISFGRIGVELNYITLLFVEIIAIIFLVTVCVKKDYFRLQHAILYSANMIVLFIGYVCGMCVMYMFKFSELEALKLASLERYLGAIFLIGAILIFGLIWELISRSSQKINFMYMGILIVVIMLITPVKRFVQVFDGTNMEEAAYVREGLSYLTKKVIDECDGNDRIYLIDQGGSGQEQLIFRYEVRPNVVYMEKLYNVDQTGNVEVYKSPEAWKIELINEYDYVAINHYDDYFKDNYGHMFEDSDDVSIHGLYFIDKETGILYPVAQEY